MATQTQIWQSTDRTGGIDLFRAQRERFAKWRLYRRTVAEMAALPNRDLADLGLHRSELKRVAYQAVYER